MGLRKDYTHMRYGWTRSAVVEIACGYEYVLFDVRTRCPAGITHAVGELVEDLHALSRQVHSDPTIAK